MSLTLLSQRMRKPYYKALGTSVINSPMSFPLVTLKSKNYFVIMVYNYLIYLQLVLNEILQHPFILKFTADNPFHGGDCQRKIKKIHIYIGYWYTSILSRVRLVRWLMRLVYVYRTATELSIRLVAHIQKKMVRDSACTSGKIRKGGRLWS